MQKYKKSFFTNKWGNGSIMNFFLQIKIILKYFMSFNVYFYENKNGEWKICTLSVVDKVQIFQIIYIVFIILNISYLYLLKILKILKKRYLKLLRNESHETIVILVFKKILYISIKLLLLQIEDNILN